MLIKHSLCNVMKYCFISIICDYIITLCNNNNYIYTLL